MLPEGSGQAADSIVQNFRLKETERCSFVFMNIVTSPWSPDMKLMASEDGYPSVFEAAGRSTAETFGYTFDAARHFLHAGFQAADMYFSRTAVSSLGNEFASLGIQRVISKDGLIFTLSCFLTVMQTEAIAGGYTSSENPSANRFCLPFFDSLAFSD
jgi:hypothetical protein